MGFDDRAYSRQSGPTPWGWLNWLVNGSIPLFTVVGIRVRAHSTMVIFVVFTFLLGMGDGVRSAGDRMLFPSLLFLIVLLHEFGHALTCRAVGGQAEDILLHPLGGLAMCAPPRRALPDFLTTIGGPAVNVVLLAAAAIAMYALGGAPAWDPRHMLAAHWPVDTSRWTLFSWMRWLFIVNYGLLLFNLIPSFPLDGGRMLFAALWAQLGHYKGLLVAVTVGMFGAGGMILYGVLFGTLVAWVGVFCMLTCIGERRRLLAEGPWAFQDEDSDYSAVNWKPETASQRRSAERAAAKAEARREREEADERAEQEKIDRILEKVHAQGMQSLNFMEKRTLKNATERQRQRTLKSRR